MSICLNLQKGVTHVMRRQSALQTIDPKLQQTYTLPRPSEVTCTDANSSSSSQNTPNIV